jgi:hypothetical protein
MSETRSGRKYEIFKFVQRYSTGAKAGRALAHGAADVATFGLWDVVGTPTEAIFSGDEMAYEVSYDQDNKVDEVTTLRNKIMEICSAAATGSILRFCCQQALLGSSSIEQATRRDTVPRIRPNYSSHDCDSSF